MKVLTVDEALKVLKQAKKMVGGNAALVLSLTDSGLPDTTVDNMVIIKDKDNSYVEVQVMHIDVQARH